MPKQLKKYAYKKSRIVERRGEYFYREWPDGYGEWNTPDGGPPY